MRMFGSERIAALMDKLGYKEGDVIQHSMISNSIQRAQKKVEENNFGIRKRLLEYDDVMNTQRKAVYDKRNHALFGERLALDLDNSFYIVAEGLVNSFREQDDYEGFKLSVIVNFGLDSTITQKKFLKGNLENVTKKLYKNAINNYQRKMKELKQQSIQFLKNIRTTQGTNIKNVVFLFTDEKKGLQVLASMKKTIA